MGTISSLSSVSTLSWSWASLCAATSRSTTARRAFSKQITLSAQGSPPPHCTRCTLEICVEASSASIGSVTPKAALARRGVNRPVTQEQRSLMASWRRLGRPQPENHSLRPSILCSEGTFIMCMLRKVSDAGATPYERRPVRFLTPLGRLAFRPR